MAVDWNKVVTLFVPIAGLILAIAVPLLQRQRKALGYRIRHFRDVTPPDAPASPVHEILVECANVGNVPIAPSDYYSELAVEFVSSSAVLAAEPFENLYPLPDVRVSVDGNIARVAPLLMNQGDTWMVTCRVLDFKRKVHVTARVAGVPRLHNIAIREFFALHGGVLIVFYCAFFYKYWNDGVAELARLSLTLSWPFIVFSVVRFVRLSREQCVWYFAFEIDGPR